MRSIRFAVIFAVAALVFLLSPSGGSQATPGVGGTPVFSVSTIGLAWDITPAPAGLGLTCTSADVLTLPGAGPVGPCAARAAPAPAGPVPDAVTFAPIDAGLNLVAGPFTDDMDGLSFREAVGVVAVADYDFSVGPAPANGGTTVGVACGPPPTVSSQAAALEAQGDIFTTAGVPVGCNVQAPTCPPVGLNPPGCDEANLGLIAPNAAAPGVPPLDNVDALAEFPFVAGPCTAVGGTFATSCAALTVTAGSAVLGAIPASVPCLGAPADGATILVPPGAPPNICTPAGCPPGGAPCIAVPAAYFGLVPAGDDMDALCWFDVNPNMVPDLPMSTMGPGGDMYMFSLTPGSASVVGAPGFSAADILGTKGLVFAPTVIRTAASLGLLPADNVDGLICHQRDGDGDVIPDALDNCPSVANGTQADGDSDGVGDVCDNCPATSNANQADYDYDTAGDACDPCTSDPSDDVDTDGICAGSGFLPPKTGDQDNCPDMANADQANADGDQFGDVCDNCPMYFTPWMVPPGDTDCDAYTDGDEGTIGTDAADPCPDNAADDAWPSDFDKNKVINITDVFEVLPPTFGTMVPVPTDVRHDLAPNGVINISDVFMVLPPIFGSSCT